MHTDHLGSVDSITDAAGNEVERRSFNAWGAPRNPKWGNPNAVPPIDSTRRGFTWHESDDEVGLVNAKGRLYDPQIARFLQVDPIITEPLDAQTHNGYSYVRNRPLVFTDPSGFSEEEAWRLWRNEESLGPIGVHVTFDKLTPPWAQPRPEPRGAAPPPPSTADVAPSTPDAPPIVMPVLEIEHPSGQGTDDPFGVFPTDLEFEAQSPITPLEQLVNGGPAGGRNFFLSESDPGFASSLNHVFGPPRETISLRPRLGGDARDYRTAAKDHLIGEGILFAATILTPGPLDDMAVHAAAKAPGLRVINSKMAHAAPRAMERAGLGSAKEAREALQAFGQAIEKNGLPLGTVKDAAGHLVVPGFGKGGAVVYRQSSQKLTLQTVLNWVEGKGTPIFPAP